MLPLAIDTVSMESGLEDRNNATISMSRLPATWGLNGVRPRRPEQYSPYLSSLSTSSPSQWSPA